MMPAGGRKAFAAVIVILILLSVACSGPSGPDPGGARVVDNGRSSSPNRLEATANPPDPSARMEVTVGPARQECYGPFRRMCLIVDGGFFYDQIDGFTHEPGYEYRLRIERYDAFPGQKEPPQDAGRYGYRLLEVLSKTRAAGLVREATVAPTRVQCPKSDEQCLLVNGRPVRDSIDGFTFQPGFDYRIRFESYDSGTQRLLDIVEQAPAQGDVEEIAVGPWRVGCYEGAPITAACIVVNGEPYYGVIEEFGRRHGYEYRLRVERYDLFPGEAGSPTELPKYGYRRIEVLSEIPAASPPPGS